MHQYINAITFKYVNNSCPYYVNEVYEYAPQCDIESRSYFASLDAPFRKTNMGAERPFIHWSLAMQLPRSTQIYKKTLF